MPETMIRPEILARRFARLDELRTIWRPSDAPEPQLLKGDISHLPAEEQEKIRQNTAKPRNLPACAMSWARYRQNVLPDADKIEMFLPIGDPKPAFGAFVALHTAVDPDAPPVLRWDRWQERNQVGWYTYPDGSLAGSWRLSGTFARVTAVVPLPCTWGTRAPPDADEGVILILEGAVDLRDDAPIGLSVSNVRPEWIDLVAEHAAELRMQGRFQASACGWLLAPSEPWAWPVNLRTLNPTGWTVYQLNGWGRPSLDVAFTNRGRGMPNGYSHF